MSCLIVVLLTGLFDVSAAIPRAEYPQPDLLRENWLKLNGEWQFGIEKDADGDARGLTYGTDLNSKITVPFCPESKLSGLAIPTIEHIKSVWYRRSFTAPQAMKGKRVRMHFGGVDYRSWVDINGRFAGMHVSENVAFTFDITHPIHDGSNEVVVKVLDDLSSGLQPSGKQAESDKSAGGCYTRTTGIWPPVWLEAVGSTFIVTISVVSDLDRSRVMIGVKINGCDPDLTLKVEAFADGKLVGSDMTKGPWQKRMVVNLTEKKLWEPGLPFLYKLKFPLYSGRNKIDELKSCFGLRKIVIDGWCAFNENFDDSRENQQMIWNITKAIDPTRPALEASGWNHPLSHSEVMDAHDYTGDSTNLRKRWRDYFSAPPAGPFPPMRYAKSPSSNGDGGVPFMVSEIGKAYHNSTDQPSDNWLNENLDDKGWPIGLAPFGNHSENRTALKTPGIYFRQTFDYDGSILKNGAVVIRINNNAEIFINGLQILAIERAEECRLSIVTEQMQKVLKKGLNILAVHSHEGGQGQWIDLAILLDQWSMC